MKVSEEYAVIANLWKHVADLFIKIGETKDRIYVNDAVEILIDLSEKERVAMQRLEKHGVQTYSGNNL